MDWSTVAIVLIAVGMLVFALIMANVQEARQRKQSRPSQRLRKGTSDPDPGPVSEAEEQRREEERRRRRAQAERETELEHERQRERDQARRRATSDPMGPMPAVVERPRSTDRRAEGRPAPTSEQAIPMARLVQRPTAKGSASVLPAPDLIPAAFPASHLIASLGEAAQVKRAPLSPIALEVRRLLRSPRGTAAAFILREIFDPPLALRRKSK